MKRPPSRKLELLGLGTLPEIRAGDDLVRAVVEAARREAGGLHTGDVVVLTQKIVSKAEGRLVRLAEVAPSELARSWARVLRGDPRFIEVVLRESRRIIRMSERVLIAETPHGFVAANAGVDHSNVPEPDCVLRLPKDPDATARRVAAGIRKQTGARVAIIVSDTFGRPWRLGLANVAIGAAGLRVLEDWRGRRDAHGRRLRATVLAVADELAAAAGLVMSKSAQVPVVIIRGYRWRAGRESARDLIRPAEEDLFR
jgi:coenzyme F420-0:L-glutamate ligase/coenzyme F420-1:gamma-L-glutamate ligase